MSSSDEEEMEMAVDHLMRIAVRLAGPARVVADQATVSVKGTSEQAVDSSTTEAKPSTSQDGSIRQQLTPPTITAETEQLLVDTSIATTLSDQLASSSTTVTPSISSPTSNQSVDASKSTSRGSVIVTDIADTGNNQPSVLSVTSSDNADASARSQKSSPLVTVTDIADVKSETQSSGASPKRKVSESDDTAGAGPAESGGAEGEPSPKEPRREEGGGEREGDARPPVEEKREDVEELVRLFNRYQRRPVSPSREQLFRQLPREVVREFRDEILYRHMYRRRRRHRPRRRRPDERYSDEDSDEEGLMRDFRDHLDEPSKFPVTNRQMLLRLLILGSATKAVPSAVEPTQNRDFRVITNMIAAGEGPQVVEVLKDVSVKGRASKQDGLVYGLALCCRSEDMETKRAAYAAVQDMIQIPTQIFQLINYIEKAGKTTGWGRGLRRALCTWYNSFASNPMRLAMHVTKYWSRHEWNHRDVFRLSHIKPVDDVIGFIIRYAVKDMGEAEKHYLEDGYLGQEQLEKVHKYLKAVEEAKSTLDVTRVVELIREHGLVQEQLRTEMLNEPSVWEVMLPNMPLTALIRNLGKMSLLRLFDDAERAQIVVSKLSNVAALKKARIHPFKLLLAHHIYRQGHGDQGKLTWAPNPQILAALESAFYRSFEAVEPTNKRILIALNISGSMAAKMLDCPIEVREAATLMAMVTLRREPNCDIVGFHHKVIPLEMFKDPNKTLDQLVQETHTLDFGATDYSKPMTWARKHGKEYDAFIIYTDSETNSHSVPPFAALDKYRKTMNIPTAKLIVVGMSAYHFSIAIPNDLHMLYVVGFDPNTPDMIREFLDGGLE